MTRRALLWALVLLALSGFIIHYRYHPFMSDSLNPGFSVFNRTNFLASLFPMIDLVLVTLLFLSRRTAIYAYLLNGMLVIFGTVFMAHFSISVLMTNPEIPSQWFTNSLLPDIAIAWADFFVGKALYESYLSGR